MFSLEKDITFKLVIGILSLIVYLSLIAFLFSKKRTRDFIIKIHASKSDKYSWTRYMGTLIILFGMLLALLQWTFDMSIDNTIVITLITLGFTSKVVQSGINSEK